MVVVVTLSALRLVTALGTEVNKRKGVRYNRPQWNKTVSHCDSVCFDCAKGL